MQKVYLKKMTKQDITKSVSVCTESVESFWDVSLGNTGYTPIRICHENNQSYIPQGITIHKGNVGEKDWRICGDNWKGLYTSDNPAVGDIMLVKKYKTYFSVRIVKQNTPEYQTLSSLFAPTDNYVIIDMEVVAPLKDPHQVIYFGAPGTGKSHAIKEKTEGYKVIRTTFHPDSDYSTFVGCYKPTTDRFYDKNGHPTTEEKITYSYSEQAFFQAYTTAWMNLKDEEPKPIFLIIEELNRGNCAQIFGDLFQLLDRKYGYSEYPIAADSDLQKKLFKKFQSLNIATDLEDEINKLFSKQYPTGVIEKIKNGELLLLPKNLYIWATMNTSDQSLFPIDSAFKRRWEWKYIPIDYEPVDSITQDKLDWKLEDGSSWGNFIKKINAIINKMTESADKQLGYFFVKANNDVISYDTFVSKVCFYLWNDIFKTYAFENAYTSIFAFKDVDNPAEEKDAQSEQLSFPSFYNGKGDVRPNIAKQFIQNILKWEESTKNNEQ